MPFRVPPRIGDSVDRWCERHEERRRAAVALRDDDVAKKSEARRDEEERHVAEEPVRHSAAHTILEWMDFLEVSGLRQRIASTGVDDLPIFGPFTRDARPTSHHSGARWYTLRLDSPPVLIEIHRHGPAWGKKTRLDTQQQIARTLPTPICLLIVQAIDRGVVWNHLRDALISGEV